MYHAVYNVHDTDYKTNWMDYSFTDSASYIKKAKSNNEDLYSDFNAQQGKKWNALYVTKNPDAGSPICGTDPDDIFLVKKGVYDANISGYEGFEEIGNAGSVNWNMLQYSYEQRKINTERYTFIRPRMENGKIFFGTWQRYRIIAKI